MVLKLKRLTPLLLTILLLCGCSDDATYMFSNRKYVFCRFDALQYAELFTVMGNPGQYASIRKKVTNGVTKITITSPSSSTDYNFDALSEKFGFGLGGLIVGTNHYGKALCYDLACPICDRAARRLDISSNDGYAKCANCGVTFNMNNYGVIHEIPEGANLPVRRGLYRYRIEYNGQIVNPHN